MHGKDGDDQATEKGERKQDPKEDCIVQGSVSPIKNGRHATRCVSNDRHHVADQFRLGKRGDEWNRRSDVYLSAFVERGMESGAKAPRHQRDPRAWPAKC